jgi:hypothetical protein
MSKERKPAVEDPGLRELSEGDLDALERLTGSYEQQAPHAWRRVRDLITDERLRRERMMRARLKPGGVRSGLPVQFVSPAATLAPARIKRAFISIESAWREMRPVALKHTTDGARARALCRVLERLGHGYDLAPREAWSGPQNARIETTLERRLDEAPFQPGMLANTLQPLSEAGADLQVVMAYRYGSGRF